jgi:hypothetical protein
MLPVMLSIMLTSLRTLSDLGSVEHVYKKHVSVRKGYIGHVSVRKGYIECTLPRSDNVRNDVSINGNIAGNIPKGSIPADGVSRVR